MYVMIAIGFSSVILILSVIYVKHYQKLNKQLFYSMNELTNEVSSLKKELVDNKSEAADIQPTTTGKSVESVKEINLMVDQKMQNFLKKLESKHGNLSVNERKLCGYLKLNMSTRQIARLTGKKEHAVEVARTRLRKKLGINNRKLAIHKALNEV